MENREDRYSDEQKFEAYPSPEQLAKTLREYMPGDTLAGINGVVISAADLQADAYGAPLLGGPGLPINPLSVASSDELIAELKTRHEAVLLCIMDVDEDAGAEGVERVRFAYKAAYACVGMAQQFIHDHVSKLHSTDEGFEREE